jgi:hypothetical protein
VDAQSHVEDARSPDARQLAERALAGLLHRLDGEDAEIVVLGGLVPEMLTRGQDPPAPKHLGTTDVDVLLLAQTMPDADLSNLEKCLRAMGFVAEREGWRWRGRVEGRVVKIEFLCDLDGAPEHEVVLAQGCTELTALNLRGTGYVAQDWTWIVLHSTVDAQPISVRARFAELGGYLLSKCVAARTRGATKDFYDLAYVLLHNRAGGPTEAAEALADGKLRDAAPVLRSTLIEIAERYRTPNAIGPAGYAEQALLADPDSDEAVLRADAVAAVGEFLDALDAATGFRA